MDTIDANRYVHAHLVEIYEKTEPHFRPENQRKVKTRLQALRISVNGGKLLDVGCGTGFIINLATDLFDEIYGIDATPEMLAKIDTQQGKIQLHHGLAEHLPFSDGYFDAVTAYSFIDHVKSMPVVLSEMARVLKVGGQAYIDLVPNRGFWCALKDNISSTQLLSLSDIVLRERTMVTKNAQIVQDQYGLDAEAFRAAEPGKLQGGIDLQEFETWALESGFSVCDSQYDWFLGEGSIIHSNMPENARVIDHYLKRTLPLSSHLYKYLRFTITR